jgi:hypothetical protein
MKNAGLAALTMTWSVILTLSTCFVILPYLEITEIAHPRGVLVVESVEQVRHDLVRVVPGTVGQQEGLFLPLLQRVQEDGQLFSAHNVPLNVLQGLFLQRSVVCVHAANSVSGV